MRKRILSLLLALLMVLGTVPPVPFAWADETAEATPCAVCGAAPCATGHVYCEVCSAYDCGVDHSVAPAAETAEQPVSSPVPCTVCGTADCGINHVYCELCSAYDCGQSHEAQQPEAPALCESCGQEPCVCETEPTVCESCGAEPCVCEAETTVCESCGAEPCVCQLSEEPDYDEDIGKYARLNADCSEEYITGFDGVQLLYFPRADFPEGLILIVEDWHVDEAANSLWYSFSAHEGSLPEAVPEGCWLFQKNIDSEEPDVFEFITISDEDEAGAASVEIPACPGEPVCWGSFNGMALNNHQDGACTRKEFVKNYVLSNTAQQIAAQWSSFTEAEQADIMAMAESYTGYAGELKALIEQGTPSQPELCPDCGNEVCSCVDADETTGDSTDDADLSEVCTRCNTEPCICVPLTSTGPASPDYSAYVGRYVMFNRDDYSSAYVAADPADETTYDFITIMDYPSDLTMVIRDWYWNAETFEYWYKVEAAPGYELPENLLPYPWVMQNYSNSNDYADALYIVDVQPENPCGCCEACTGEDGCECECEDCTFKSDELCPICGTENCSAVHFWCDICKTHDCGVSHLYCVACGEMDCSVEHVFCPVCGEYDCGLVHEDEFTPDTAPVIPANPVLTGADVSIVDETGAPVTSAGLALEKGKKTSLSAWPAAGEGLSYQWQICYDPANDLWADIHGETGKGILVSPAMFLSLINYQGGAYLRCVAASGDAKYVSASIPVIVTEAVPEMSLMYAAPRALSAAPAAAPAAEGDGTTYSIIIEYKFDNGSTAAQPYTANLAAGADYVLDVESPAVLGYKPDRERITETINGISGNLSYTIIYSPDYVDYKTEYYQQALVGNDYALVDSVTVRGLTGSPVGTGLNPADKYPGFYALGYDDSLVIAADGSTVVKVYYDRNYYMLSLNLNGGYGAEPLFARYGTPVNSAAFIPQQTGYTFAGWEPELPAVITAHTSHTAQWDKAGTQFSVAFWYENANDEEYTFVGSAESSATTGSIVNGEAYRDLAFDGRDDEHFTYEKADTNVEILADGSTVVNVYFTRNSYTLSYLKYRCSHTHTTACCSLTQHTHSHSECCTSNWLPEWMHAHQYASCPVGYEHTHGSGCNSDACTHGSGFNCTCDNSIKWYSVYSGTFKYEQDVSAVHAAQGAERWCPGACEGLKDKNGNYYASYGGSPAHGVYSSMGGGDVVFYQGSTGPCQYYLTYWLETYDGSGSRNYKGRNFAQGTTFTPKMGAVGYQGDYKPGIPVGFAEFEAWASDSQGGSNLAQLTSPDGSFSGNTYNFYNFYYIRQSFTLTYFNGSNTVATRTMKYDEPLTSDYNLQNLSMVSPYGPGYEFAGWYLDPKCSVRENFNGTSRMPDGGMALYAKWAPTTHTVRAYIDSNSMTGTPFYQSTALHGGTVAVPPNEPTNGVMNFVGWFYMDNGEEKAYDFSMPVNRDMDLYGVWTSDTIVKGTISYMIEGTNTRIADDIPASGFVGATKTYDAKTGTELYTAYQSGYFPVTSSHNIQFSSNQSQNNFTFYYKQMPDVGYTVRYLEKGTNKVLRAETAGTSKSGKITIQHIPISGYAADAFSKDIILSSDPSLNVVTFWYTEDSVHAPVQVEHYIQNTRGDGYLQYFTEQPYNGTIGQVQTASPLTISGFTYNKSNNSINGVKLTASGLVLKLYYDRNTYPYEFRFLKSGTNEQLSHPVSGNGLFGAAVTQSAASIPGYKLTSGASNSMSITIAVEDPATVASKNVRTFYYVEDSVTISYAVGAVKGGSVAPTSETVLAVTGTPTGSTATANGDYKFVAWFSDYSLNNKLSENIHFVPTRGSNNVYEKATYYAGFEENKVTLNYEIVAPTGGEAAASLSKTSEQVSVVSGTAAGSTLQISDERYRFEGWYSNIDCQGTVLSTNASYTPTKSYSAKWVDGTTYYAKIVEKTAEISYVAVGPGSVAPTAETVDMVTGKASGSTAAAAENISRFVGWYDNAQCSGTVLSTDVAFVPTIPTGGWPAAGSTYYAKFENISYTINFEDSANPEANIPSQSYVYGDALDLPELTNGNYVVTWTVKESDGNWPVGSTVTDSTLLEYYGNATLIASWSINVIWIDWDTKVSDLFVPGADLDNLALEIDENVPYGTEHTYDGQAPTRAEDEKYSYSFDPDGWKEEALPSLPGVDLAGVVIYRASYEETENKATITYNVEVDGHGKVKLNSESSEEAAKVSEEVAVVIGAPLGATAIPDAGYKFIGWYDEDGKEVSTEAAFVPSKAGDALWEETSYTAKFELALVDLTISTSCTDDTQSFIFEVIGQPEDYRLAPVKHRVILVGTDSVTLKAVPVGIYTVTEVGNWSWRHNEYAVRDSITVEQNTIVPTFAFGAEENNKWLSGFSTYNPFRGRR